MKNLRYSGRLLPFPYGGTEPTGIGMFVAQSDDGQWYYSEVELDAGKYGLAGTSEINREIKEALARLVTLTGRSSGD